MLTIGEKFKSIRRALVLSQIELANDLGVVQSYISQIESGDREPSLSLIKLLKLHYSINEHWWNHGEGSVQLPSNSNNHSFARRAFIEACLHDSSVEDLYFIIETAVAILKNKELNHNYYPRGSNHNEEDT